MVALAAATDAPLRADMIVNGGFESVVGGTFDSWTYVPATSGGLVALSTSAPTAVDGTSARLLFGSTNGGTLMQTVSDTGVSDFVLDVDFAVLSTSSTGIRTFSLVTYQNPGGPHSGADNIDSLRVWTTAANRYEILIYDRGNWVNTGLLVTPTPDIGGDRRFDDGELPVVNHLTVTGTGYGSPNQTITITLIGGETSGTFSRDLCYVSVNAPVKDIGFYSVASSADFLIDNVAFAALPEPATCGGLALGFLSLLICARRTRR